ncbi:septal ring lytic transglycosylase RlpA family protein [Colwelliaceae bacterium 6441]
MYRSNFITLKFYCLVILLITTACSSNYGRYQQKNDSTPTRKPSSLELRDATPRAENKSKGGNKNYQVRGKHYQVLPSAKGFKQSGIASWYGKKFHGHLTSNGEIYNMYGMSAAHKNLPLPTYVKVTNNENQKTVIVRVNDRGPFHQSRIIDLSYSAAYKLGMLKTGTANVTIGAITDFPKKSATPPVKNKAPSGSYIQVFATKDKQIAKEKATAIGFLFRHPTSILENKGIYKVQVGPFNNQTLLKQALQQLKSNGYPKAFKASL